MRYFVLIRDHCHDAWRELGSVLLPPGSDDEAVEGALVAIGAYAPLGLDELEWFDEEVATIRDAEGFCMVRLVAAPRLKGKAAR